MFKRIVWRRVACAGLLAGMAAAGQHMYRAERHWLRDHKMDERETAFSHAARLFQLDIRLLEAVARRETGMDPMARGAAGEIGLFQIMPNTALHWAQRTDNPVPSEEDLFNVGLNTHIAAWYLRQGLDRFAHREDPLPFALAYYNAGPGRAVRWERELPPGTPFESYIPFPGTRSYVRAILEDVRRSP